MILSRKELVLCIEIKQTESRKKLIIYLAGNIYCYNQITSILTNQNILNNNPQDLPNRFRQNTGYSNEGNEAICTISGFHRKPAYRTLNAND